MSSAHAPMCRPHSRDEARSLKCQPVVHSKKCVDSAVYRPRIEPSGDRSTVYSVWKPRRTRRVPFGAGSLRSRETHERALCSAVLDRSRAWQRPSAVSCKTRADVSIASSAAGVSTREMVNACAQGGKSWMFYAALFSAMFWVFMATMDFFDDAEKLPSIVNHSWQSLH